MKYIHESSLLDRVKDFDIPPESLDLLTAPEEQLRQYGVPPRPDPELQQERYRVWLSFFVPRPTFVSADITIIPDRFRSVTVPGVRQVTTLVALLAIITGANLFTEPYLLTGGGGPAGKSTSPVLQIYQTGIEQNHPDFAAALGVILVVGVLLIVGVQQLVQRRQA